MFENTLIIVSVLVIYKMILIGIGLWGQRRSRDIDGFLIGNRQLGPVVAAVSYAASSSSAWTLLGMSGIAFSLGLSAIWFVVGSIAGMLVSWTFVAPKLLELSHQHKFVTLTDILLLDVTKPSWRRLIIATASITTIACFVFYVAAQLQGAGQTFHHVFNVSQNNSIVIGAVIVLMYTLLGGFWAVSITDTLQGILMAIAAILLPVTAYVKLGGFQEFWIHYQSVATVAQLSWFNSRVGLASFGFSVSIVAVSLGTFGQPHLLVRFMALRSKSALIQARIIALFWFAVVFGGMFFVGLAGRVLVSQLNDSESVFLLLTEQLFSPIVAGIIIASLLSAIMSTADSQLLAGATAISHDLRLGRSFEGRDILVSRIAITVMLILSCLIAVSIPATIFDRALLAWSALGATFGPIVIARVLNLRPSDGALFSAMTMGFCIAVWFHFNPNSLSWLIDSTILPGSIYERIGSFFLGLTIIFVSHHRGP